MDLVTWMFILGYGLFIRRFIRWPMEALPLFLTAFIIVIFYIFSYVNFLNSGSQLFMLTGIFLLLISPIYLYNERKKLFSDYITPGFVFFIIYLLVFKHLTHGLMTFNNDEINRWVPHIQFINFYHRLWQFKDSVGEQDYPPAGALLNYFFLKLPGFAEGRLYFIHLFLLTCPFVILFRHYRWRDLFTLILVAFLLFKLFAFLLGPRLFILMDQPSGLFFGGFLASYYFLTKEKYLWIYLCVVASAFVLFKPMLYSFLLLSAVIIFIDQLYLRTITKKSFISLLTNTFFLLFIPALFLYSWNYYITHANPNSLRWGILSWQKNSNLNPTEIHLVITNFIHNLPLTIIFYITLCCGIIYFLIPDRLNKKRFIITQCLLFLGYIAFLFSVLLTYLTKFTSSMAIELNSFSRFVCIYQLGWILAVIAQGLALIDIHKFKFNAKHFGINRILPIAKYSILALLMVHMHHSIHMEHKHKEMKLPRSGDFVHYALKQMVIPIKKLTNENANISVIWMGGASGVYMQYIILYEIFPRPTHINFLDDSHPLTNDILHNITEKADYLLVGYVEPTFWQQFGNYFQGRKPLTFTQICMSKRLEDFNGIGCKLHDIPIYLYKVIHQQGEPKMVPV